MASKLWKEQSNKIVSKRGKIWAKKDKGVKRPGGFEWSDQRFDKAFALDSELCQDCIGTTWKGRHIESGTEVAIKKISHFVEHYVNVAVPLQKRLVHPNILRYYGTIPVSHETGQYVNINSQNAKVFSSLFFSLLIFSKFRMASNRILWNGKAV